MKKPDRGHPVAFMHSGNKCKRAYLLAGGDSLRMGQDKLFLPFGNRTLLDQVYTTLTERFVSVKIAARTDTKFTESPYEVVIDSPRAKGPMAGLIASLEDCPDPCCFVGAVDLPDISTKLIDQLLMAYGGEDYFGIEESSQSVDQPTRSIQPLCGIWSTSALPTLYHLADADNYRLSDLLELIRTASLSPLTDRWRNLNYPTDLDHTGGVHG